MIVLLTITSLSNSNHFFENFRCIVTYGYKVFLAHASLLNHTNGPMLNHGLIATWDKLTIIFILFKLGFNKMNDIKLHCCICDGDFGRIYELDLVKEQKLREYDSFFYGGSLAKIFSKNEYRLRRCLDCGHYQYLWNIDENKLFNMYSAHTKFKLQKKNYLANSKNKNSRKIAITLIEQLKGMSPSNPTLLDYGSGSGLWAGIARDAGFNVTAYEPHQVRTDKKMLAEGNWEKIENKKFDVIICNQVLEHVNAPKLLVSKLQSVSKSGTLLYCAVPNAGSVSEKKIMAAWPFDGNKTHILVPFQHLNGFTQKSLIICLTSQNFRISLLNNFQLNLRGFRNILALLTRGILPRLSTTGIIFHMDKS